MTVSSGGAGRSRAQQREATRTALMAAGVKAFAAKGHDGVNLAKDILEPVGISVGSFYHQFDNKTDLLLAIIEFSTKMAEARSQATLPPDGTGMNPEVVRDSWDGFLSAVDFAEDVVTIQLREAHSPHPEIADAIRQLTNARIKGLAARYRDIARPDVTVDADAMADMLAALSRGVLTTYLHTPADQRPHRKPQLVEHLTTMTLNGVPGFIHPRAPPAGRPQPTPRQQHRTP